MDQDMYEQLIHWIQERLAVQEGGEGTIHISWDDATRDYIISQTRISSGKSETLGCSRSIRGAIFNALTGKVYE